MAAIIKTPISEAALLPVSGVSSQTNGESTPIANVVRYVKAVLARDQAGSQTVILEFLDKNHTMPETFDILTRALVEIGNLWERGVITVADEYFGTQTVLENISMIANHFRNRTPKAKIGSALLLSSAGEFHYVGLKMFAELLTHSGWAVEFYGPSVPIAEILKSIRARKEKIDLVCLSVTMQFNIDTLMETVRILRGEATLASAVIIAGGSLFRSKTLRDPPTAGIRGRLVDYVASDFGEGLQYASQVAASRLFVTNK